jgi:polyisoprenoid-binding protein YceI
MGNNLSKLVVVLLFFLGAISLNAEKLVIDKNHSEVGFTIKHLMISNVKGKFATYNANMEFDTKTKKFTKFIATIKATSIDTGIEKRDNHLRSPDFFDVVKYPDITFTMNSYKADGDEGVLKGELTVHGVTKPIELEVEFNGTVKDPWGGTRAGFTLEGKINRKDFGLTWNKALEAGGVLVGDKVKLHIELETHVK